MRGGENVKIADKLKSFIGLKASVEGRKEYFLNDPELSQVFLSQNELPEAVYSIISRVSNAFASLPLKMIDKDYKQPSDCAAYNLLSDGPRYFTKFDFFRDIEAIRSYQGNAYVQIFRDVNGKIKDLALIKPGCCEPVFDAESGELYYQISASDSKQYGKTLTVHYKEILHFKQTRIGRIKGENPTSILTNTLTYDNKVRQISIKQLNGSNEGLKVNFASNMDEEKKMAVVKNIAKFYQENGGLLVEENGVTIERLQRDLVDAKLLDTDKISRSRIAMVYNVPEHFVGATATSYSSQEQLNMEFLTYTLLPLVNQYEEELNKKTLTPEEKRKGYRYKFNVSALLRADTATRGNFYQIMRRNGAYTANMVLMLEDMAPSEEKGMNEHHISGDLYPISMDPQNRNRKQSVADDS